MSQRILIHTRGKYVQNNQPRACCLIPTFAEVAGEHVRRGVIVTHQVPAPRDGLHLTRNQFNSSTKGETDGSNGGLDVQVRIEQAVVVDIDSVYGREGYPQNPQAVWDKELGATRDKSPTEQNQWAITSVDSIARPTATV